MRFAVVIISLAAIAAGLVTFRRLEVSARHEVQQSQRRLIAQRRVLADQEVRLGKVQALEAVDARAEEMGVVLSPPGTDSGYGSAGRLAVGGDN